MSQASTATAPSWQDRLQALPWALWTQQVAAISRFELKRIVLGRRFIGVLFLASLPVLLGLLRALVELPPEAVRQMGGLSVIYAIIYRTFLLRLVVFFGCVSIFGNLFRGDVLERTLHYYFLAPVRRDVLVAGKYVAGVILSFVVLGSATAATFILLYLPAGLQQAQRFFLEGPGLGHLTAYLFTTLLACLEYGSVFLLMGLLFRNPVVAAAGVLGWESINFLLPPFLKKISVIYYLESLCPVPLPPGPITLLADPAPAWVAVPGLLVLTGILLVLSAVKLRHTEINYSAD